MSDIFEVERILQYKYTRKNRHMFLIYWKGYPLSACTWEPLENLKDSPTTHIKALKMINSAKKTGGTKRQYRRILIKSIFSLR